VAGTRGSSFGDWLIDVELPGRGMELTEFARQLDVSTSTIYRWRAHNPRSNMVGRVARLLGYSYVELAERFGMGRKKTRDNDDEAEHVRRTVEELAAYPDDVYEKILARVEAERRKQEESNRKDS
jgi:hypothetical protein